MCNSRTASCVLYYGNWPIWSVTTGHAILLRGLPSRKTGRSTLNGIEYIISTKTCTDQAFSILKQIGPCQHFQTYFRVIFKITISGQTFKLIYHPYLYQIGLVQNLNSLKYVLYVPCDGSWADRMSLMSREHC